MNPRKDKRMKPKRHIWGEGSTNRSVGGDYYDDVWDYAEQLEAENEKIKEHLRTFVSGLVTVEQMYILANALLTGEQDETE